MSKKDEKERVILMRTAEGEFKVTVPPDAKLTFGPAIPGPSKSRGYEPSRMEYAVRIYKGSKENLLAVFTGVYNFRDIEMPVAKLIVREAGKSVWKSDETGYKVEEDVKKSGRFVDDLHLLEAGNADKDEL